MKLDSGISTRGMDIHRDTEVRVSSSALAKFRVGLVAVKMDDSRKRRMLGTLSGLEEFVQARYAASISSMALRMSGLRTSSRGTNLSPLLIAGSVVRTDAAWIAIFLK